MKAIKFGTDGWRGIIGKDFTFDNLQIVTQALAYYMKDKGLDGKGIFIGYDNRSHSEDFAKCAAEICSGAGIETLLSNCAVPSPAVSYTVNSLNLGCGIMITASHNPPEWNGFKIKENFGGSAFPETTKQVESQIKDTLSIVPSDKKVAIYDAIPAYLNKIKSLVDIDLLKTHKIKIVIDPMFGSGIGLFKKLGLDIFEIRNQRDTKFGGINPEPLPKNLQESISFVKRTAKKYENEITACIVLDGDADRLAAIDGTGRFINTHNVFTLLLRQLSLHRKLKGEVVKTFNLSNLIDALCNQYKLNLTVTPIGFKHIAKLMLEKEVLLGGEESGGMGIKGNIPERDGTLAGLMLLELIAYEKRSLAQILDGIMDEFGYFYYDRLDIHTEKAQSIVERLKTSNPKEFSGKKIAKIETLDGYKISFENQGWILFRASGTEPLLRIYVEGRTPAEVRELIAAGKKLA